MSEKPKKQSIGIKEAIPKLEHYCAWQERCHSEVVSKMYDLGLHPNEHDEAMAHLIKRGFLNEERFAIAFAGGKFRQKGWGLNKIKRELKARSVSEYCIKKALAEIERDDYLDKLGQVAEKYIRTHSGLRGYELKNKLLKYLISKGYEYDLCQSITAKLGLKE